MPVRHDRDPWTPEEDAHLTQCFAVHGMPVPKAHAHWPKKFPKRSLAAIRMRKQALGVLTASNPAVSQKGVPQPPPPVPEQEVEQRDTQDGVEAKSYGRRIKTVADLLKHIDADLTKFEVSQSEATKNEQVVRDPEGKIRVVEYHRVFVRLKPKAGLNAEELVRAVIDGAFAVRRPVVPIVRKSTGDPAILQAIAIADPHIGKLAWPTETGGGPYDTPIAIDTLGSGVSYLMTEGDEREVGARRFCLLGDYLHHDGRGMTTKGTVLDYDSRVKKMMREGTQLLCDLIAQSAERTPTTVSMVVGNHDFVLTFALQEALFREFRKHPRVTIDDRSTPTQFFQWGKCLIGLDHGDKGKKRLPDKMVTACEVEWGETTHREILTGHLHSKAAIDTMGGIVIRTMDSLATADAFHAQEKFDSSPRTIEAFRYHKGGMLAGTDSWSPDLNRAPRRGTQ